ncbi:DNA binding domain with preference for A/T rich regions [Rhizoctonia solani]|uniref:DNA binding domain with preference for A/T rich regions n=1 Tax=Rhizoctonia solani TaxID=456999 RepID=A0A8H7LH45_9AGAM|nr:DNA binding domain with preference for A/T rich regions [Rhizoctonia solani]
MICNGLVHVVSVPSGSFVQLASTTVARTTEIDSALRGKISTFRLWNEAGIGKRQWHVTMDIVRGTPPPAKWYDIKSGISSNRRSTSTVLPPPPVPSSNILRSVFLARITMNFESLSPAASLSPPSISSGDTDSDDQHISSPTNSFSYHQLAGSSSSSASTSESPDLGFDQFMPDIGLQATMQELGMSIDGWEQWNDTNKPIVDPAMLFLDLDGLVTDPTTVIEPPQVINPNLPLPKSKFAAARASHLLSIPSAPTLDIPQLETQIQTPIPKSEPLSAADDIAQRILARTRAAKVQEPQVQPQPQMSQFPPHIPGSMPGIVMPSLPPVPRAGANPNPAPTDPNAFTAMQLDANAEALEQEYLAILQNAQSMPDFFSAAFGQPNATPSQQPPALPTLPDGAAKSAPPPLRTKTSHTTIERRYRTNLNTRITALRHAVPALRVLDKAAFPNEQPDEHGLCDGVRPARKASKASVLGKATEYIRVLKRREKRLEGKVGGLKALVKCVSGEDVVREWEAEWVRVHGGPETDSIGVDDQPEAEGDGDDDDSDGDEPKAKRARPTTANPSLSPPQQAGEKRKRGRPRKSPQTETFPNAVPVAIAPAPSDNGKYLLGVFLFFSFFKGQSPAASHHTHSGSVISPVISPSGKVETPWDFAHAAHTIFSIVLLLSLVLSWVRSLSAKKQAQGVEGAKKVLAKGSPTISSFVFLQLLTHVLLVGRELSAISRFWTAASLYFSVSGPEEEQSEREAVLALLLAPVCAPLAKRFWSHAAQTPVRLEESSTPEPSSPSSEPATPRPGSSPATNVRTAVLSLPLHDAEQAYLSALSGSGSTFDTTDDDIFDFIAASQVVDVLFDLAVRKFVETSHQDSSSSLSQLEQEEETEEATKSVCRLGHGLQSPTLRSLVVSFETLRSSPSSSLESEKIKGVRALIKALELYRKVYPDPEGVLTPTGGSALALRVALGDAVFDSSEELEDARDWVVERLVGAC